MHASFPRQAFVDALSEAAAVIPARSPKPILQSVRVGVGPDGSSIVATDLDAAVRRSILQVNVVEPGVAVIPAAKLRSILSTSDDDDFEIKAAGESAVVRFSRSSFKLPLANPDEYPEIPGFGDGPYLSIESRHLDRMIRGTIFAIDEKSTKYALCGVLLEMSGGRLWGVGTDGRRLAICRADVEPSGETDKAWEDSPPIVPAKGLRLLSRAIEEGDPPVHMALVRTGRPVPTGILFRTERSVIFSRLAEGRFPRYDDVTTLNTDFGIDFAAHTLRRAIDHAAVMTSDTSFAVDFSFGPGSLVLSGQSADIGESSVEVDCVGPESARRIAFQPNYVTDPLKALEKEDDVRVEIGTDKDPIRLRFGPDYECIVMPVTRTA